MGILPRMWIGWGLLQGFSVEHWQLLSRSLVVKLRWEYIPLLWPDCVVDFHPRVFMTAKV